MSLLAVFPLGDVVFFPSSSIPLNIFEPRYIQMVNDALEKKLPIALSQGNPGQGTIVGFGEPILLNRREDSSMVILLQGKGKARLKEFVSEEPYLLFDYEPILERDDVTDENRFALNRMTRLVHTWFEEHIPDVSQRQMLSSTIQSPKKIIETLAMVKLQEASLQQALLEMDDINDRIRLLKFMI